MKTIAPNTATTDPTYASFLRRIQQRFESNTSQGKVPLLTTNAEGLWETYLDSFADPVKRQYHNCHACRQFIERFGSLAVVSEGVLVSAVWDAEDADEEYHAAISALSKVVRRAKANGVFLSSDKVWGTPQTGEWSHLSVAPTKLMLFKSSIVTAGQAMAEKREDFKTVMRALDEFGLPCLETAVSLLKSEALYRSEKILGQAEWLLTLQRKRDTSRGRGTFSNALWEAVATAPAGFCHPRSGMIGTLLEDIAAGKSFPDVSRAFAAKMHPLSYQRPQAAPTSGAIAAAEKVFQKMQAAGSLERRFARLDEVQAVWRPQVVKSPEVQGGVFSHLKTKAETPQRIAAPPQTMTWDKFCRVVLPTATKMELLTPRTGSYTALVTAANADAPPILQWDSEEQRNPVSWYFWNGGSSAESFGLPSNQFVEVNLVSLKPCMWNGGNEHQGKGVMFALAGAGETKQSGNALFPEILKSEFHSIRSVIEAYARGATIAGMSQPHAAGIMFNAGDQKLWNATLRVWTSENESPAYYNLDRWD